MEDLHKYYKKLEEDGYITHQGNPLKCIYCDNRELVDTNIITANYGVEEYDVKCDNCGKITGRWVYGYWALMY